MTRRSAGDFIDLRDVIDDPVEALARSDGMDVLLMLPLAKVRNLGPLAFPVTRDAGEPLISTVQDYLNGRCNGYGGSSMQRFYALWTPGSAAAVLGMSGEEASPPLAECAPHAFVYPWASRDPRLRQHNKVASMRNENRNKGADIAAAEGYIWAGPLSRRKGEFEFVRLRLLTDSIRKYGYETNANNGEADVGNIKGRLMLRGGAWRVLGTTGNHRRAVLAGLGWSHAPVQVRAKTIRCEDIATWPNVRNGLFTEDQALRIFDRIFEGRQPVGCPTIEAAATAG